MSLYSCVRRLVTLDAALNQADHMIDRDADWGLQDLIQRADRRAVLMVRNFLARGIFMPEREVGDYALRCHRENGRHAVQVHPPSQLFNWLAMLADADRHINYLEQSCWYSLNESISVERRDKLIRVKSFYPLWDERDAAIDERNDLALTLRLPERRAHDMVCLVGRRYLYQLNHFLVLDPAM